MGKSFWIPLMASFGAMIFLYIIGFAADIDFLKLKISLSETEIALLPIAVGMLVGVVSERLFKLRSQ